MYFAWHWIGVLQQGKESVRFVLRYWLQLIPIAGAAVGSSCGILGVFIAMAESTMTTDYDCIVLGTGGVGSAALYHLSKRSGLRVLGIDQFEAGHCNGRFVFQLSSRPQPSASLQSIARYNPR